VLDQFINALAFGCARTESSHAGDMNETTGDYVIGSKRDIGVRFVIHVFPRGSDNRAAIPWLPNVVH